MENETLKLSDRYEIAGQDIVHETIEGEVVIVNLKNGFYYSTEKTGCHVWNMIVAGYSHGEITQTLNDCFPGYADEINASTRSLISDLLGENLIMHSAGSSGQAAAENLSVELDSEFFPPVLEKHKEMQDLLLVDPIHEVADSGWPNKKVEQAAGE
ncbi:PqqD family protein [Pseudomonadota bacterium]